MSSARPGAMRILGVHALVVAVWLTAPRALGQPRPPSASFWGVDAGVGVGTEERSAPSPIGQTLAGIVFQPGLFWQERLAEVFWVGPRASWRVAPYSPTSGHAVDLSAYGTLSWPMDRRVEARLAFAVGPAIRFPPQLVSIAIEHHLDPAVSGQGFVGLGLARTSASARFRIYGDLRLGLLPYATHRHRMTDTRTGETSNEDVRIAAVDVQLVFGIGGVSP